MKKPAGLYSRDPGASILAFTSSLPVDQRLAEDDIRGSLAHVQMLARRKIISGRDARAISRGLRQVLKGIRGGRISPGAKKGAGRLAGDDIHMAVESLVRGTIGRAGGNLHTARSRNDQVALDERLYLVRAGDDLQKAVRQLQASIVRKARRYQGVLMPGYTHLQRAQPVLLGHHLLAYVSMLERDRGRLRDAVGRARFSPLGAAALAGTSFPIDRKGPARALGLDGVEENSIDAVADRDALIEFTAACAVTMMHLSRLAEELVLWSSREWGFVRIGDESTPGSSIMPQKKNPDVAELIRGKTGRVYGDLVALLTIMKALPLAYNRDLQEDKPALFDAVDTTGQSSRMMARMLTSVRFNVRRFEVELRGDPALATELADYLARKGVPFREAHAAVGAVVAECTRARIALADLPLARYRKHHSRFGADLYRVLDPRGSVKVKKSAGSTSPTLVAGALKKWERRLRLLR